MRITKLLATQLTYAIFGFFPLWANAAVVETPKSAIKDISFVELYAGMSITLDSMTVTKEQAGCPNGGAYLYSLEKSNPKYTEMSSLLMAAYFSGQSVTLGLAVGRCPNGLPGIADVHVSK